MNVLKPYHRSIVPSANVVNHKRQAGAWIMKALPATFLAFALLAGCKKQTPPVAQDDAALTQAVQAKLAGDTAIASEPIQASVQEGVVTLAGTASSDAARALAANDAAQVAGVRTVVNNLALNAPAPAPAKTATLNPPAPATPRDAKTEKHVRTTPDIHKTEQPRPNIVPDRVEPAPPAPIERAYVPQPPAPAPVPEVRSITVPADTAIAVRLSQTLDSATTQQGDTFSGVLASDILVDGRVVVRQGSGVSGRVDTVQEAAHFKGNSLLTIQLTSLDIRGSRLPVTTDTFSKAGNGRGKNSAEKIGGGAAVGAILGGIFGGGKGAAIGAAAGGGVGAGAQAVTRGQQVQIPAESLVRFRLTSPVTVRVSGNQSATDNELQHHN